MVTQLAAASRALDWAGVKIIATVVQVRVGLIEGGRLAVRIAQGAGDVVSVLSQHPAPPAARHHRRLLAWSGHKMIAAAAFRA